MNRRGKYGSHYGFDDFDDMGGMYGRHSGIMGYSDSHSYQISDSDLATFPYFKAEL